jgi:predicted dehydrogenase
MTSFKTANVGIVGGGIRGGLFARAIQENPLGQLIAVCDSSPRARDTVASKHDVPGYASVGEMLIAHPELTAAVIATPDFAHKEAAIACAAAGLDLMIEKPLATSTSDAEAIIEAAAAGGARIMVGFENRWNPRFSAVRELLKTPDSGSVLNQIISLNDTVFVPTKMLSWAAKSSPAWFLMPHSLDLAMWLGGARPISVHAVGVKRVLPALGVDTWDCISATFVMDDGSTSVLHSSWILPQTAPAVYDFRYELQTSTDAFYIDVSNQGITHYSQDRVSWPQWGVTERAGRIGGVPVDMVNDFIDFVRGSVTTVPTATQGLIVTHAIEAVHRSLENGESVSLTTGENLRAQAPVG